MIDAVVMIEQTVGVMPEMARIARRNLRGVVVSTCGVTTVVMTRTGGKQRHLRNEQSCARKGEANGK